MGEALLTRRGGSGGSGEIINGIIEEYYAATEDINANTFVEFVGNPEYSDATTEFSFTNYYSYDAVVVNENTVLMVICRYDSSAITSVSGVVITIQDGTATFSTEQTLYTYSTTYAGVAFIRVEELSSEGYYLVVLAGTGGNYASDQSWEYIVVRYNAGTLSAGSRQHIPVGRDVSYSLSMKKVAEGTILMVGGLGSKVQGAFMTQNDSNKFLVTYKGQTFHTVYNWTQYYQYAFKFELLPGNKLFFLIPYAESSLSYNCRIHIYSYDLNNKAFTLVTNSLVGPEDSSVYWSFLGSYNLIKLSDTKFFVSFTALYSTRSSTYQRLSTTCYILNFNKELDTFYISNSQILTIDGTVPGPGGYYGLDQQDFIKFTKVFDNLILCLKVIGVRQSFTWRASLIHIVGSNMYELDSITLPTNYTASASYANRSRLLTLDTSRCLLLNYYKAYAVKAKTLKVPDLKLEQSNNYIAGLLTSKATTTKKGKVAILSD